MKLAHYLKNKLLKAGADDVLVRYTHAEGYHVKFSDNKIVKTGSEVVEGIGVFASFRGKLLFTGLKRLNEKAADDLVKQVGKFVEHIEVNKDYRGIAKGPFSYRKLQHCYDKKILDVDDVDVVEQGIQVALQQAERTNGVFDRTIGKSLLVGSNNVEVEDEFTGLYFSLRAFSGDGSGHSNSCSRMLKDLQVEESAAEAGRLAAASRNPVEGKSGKFDIVFGTMPVTVLMNHVMDAASYAHVESGMSFLAGKLRKPVGKISLIDEGNLQGGYGSMVCDEEGVPARKTAVIQDGILRTYLHNTSTALRMKTRTTANAGLISPSAWNIVLEKGKCEQGNVRDVKNGLYISNIWYTRYQNYATGDFSTIPRDAAFVIKNGELVQPIKNIRISDNMLNILKNITMVGNQAKQLKNWEADTPCVAREILVKGVKVTRAES